MLTRELFSVQVKGGESWTAADGYRISVGKHPRDLRDRHLLRPAQPANLSPVIYAQHLLPPRLGCSQGLREGWSNSVCRAVISIQLPPTKLG